MKRWVILLAVVAPSAGLALAAGFMWWAHHTYTVGFDLNFKAIAVAGVAGLVVAAAAAIAVRARRKRQRQEASTHRDPG